jgi:hypothetical protein
LLKINDHEFPYGLIVNQGLNVHGSVHTTADGGKRLQYALNEKMIFSIVINYATDLEWQKILLLINENKEYDSILIDHEGKEWKTRLLPETISKTAIVGTNLGYTISFNLIEV